ncbi:MAG: SPOR domain-containing protein [Pseudomonadota bacterium]
MSKSRTTAGYNTIEGKTTEHSGLPNLQDQTATKNVLNSKGQNYAANNVLQSNDGSEYTQVGGQRGPNQNYIQPEGSPGQGATQGDLNSGIPANQPDYSQYNYQSPNTEINNQYQQQAQPQPAHEAIDYSAQNQNLNFANPNQGDPNLTQSYNNNYSQPSPSYDDPSRYSYPGAPQNEGYLPAGQYADPSYAYGDPATLQGGDPASYYGASADQGYTDQGYYENEFADGGYEDESEGRSYLGVILSVMIGAIAVGGGVTYAYQNGLLNVGASNQASATPETLSADRNPVKFKPEDPGGKVINNSKKLIYSRVSPENSGTNSTGGVQLQSRQENVTGLTLNNSNVSNEEGSRSPRSEGPRKVKTLVVRPDGSMQVGEQRTNVRTQQSPARVAAIPKRNSTNPPKNGVGISLGDIMSSSNDSGPRPKNAVKPNPQPQQRQRKIVSALPQNSGASSTIARQGLTPPKPAPVQARPQVSAAPTNSNLQTAALVDDANNGVQLDGGRFTVQIAARRERIQALETFADLQQKYPSLLNSYKPIIQKADLGQKGVWYRLRIGPISGRNSAANLCEKLKTSGVRNCFVRPL